MMKRSATSSDDILTDTQHPAIDMTQRLTQRLPTGSSPDGRRIGLALSGGGARGLAHAGALQAIEEAGIPIDVLAGVSAGSIVAVMYAAGIKPQTILDIFLTTGYSDLAVLAPGHGGILKISRCADVLRSVLGNIVNFEDLQIPTYVGVTNFDEGIPVEFHSGPIARVVQASCSIPIAIRPVVIDDTTYVDGGVLHNLPAWIIRDKCDTLIGINVSPVLPKHKDYKSLFAVAMRTYTLLAKSNQVPDMAMCDLAVRIDGVSGHHVFSLKELTDVYDIGYATMKKALEESTLFNPPPKISK